MRGPSTVLCGVAVAIAVLGALAGCGDGGNPDDPEDKPGMAVSFSPTSLSLVQGQTGSVQVTITRSKGLKGTLLLAATGLPPDIATSFNPASLPEGSSTSTLTISPSATTGTGTLTVFVEATVDGQIVNIDGGPTTLALTIALRPGISVSKVGTGSGTVTSSPAGINCGSVCTAQFDPAPVTLTATPAVGSAFVSWGDGCTGTTLTCTLTPGKFGSSVTATFNSTAQAIAVSVSPSPVTVQAGGSSTTATVSVTRINGFANPVAIALTAPTGLSVSANPTSITGNTSTLTIGAGASLGAGNYQVTITATGTGVTQQVVTLPVQVTPSPSGGAINFNYAGCATPLIPVWFGVQNGTGAWTRVTPTSNAFTFTIGATGAIGIVTQSGTDTETELIYASAAEFTAMAIAGVCRSPTTGTKILRGQLGNAGVIGLDTAQVLISGVQWTKPNTTDVFNFANVPAGPRDFIATTKRISNLSMSRMILRRGTNYANGTNLGLLDFGGIEAFAPKIGGISMSNLGTDTVALEASLITTNGSSLPYFSISGSPVSLRVPYFGLPDTLQRDGDFHAVSVVAVSKSANGNSYRFHQFMQRSPNEKSIPFGPTMVSRPVVTTTGTSPNLRFRAQMPTQAIYTSLARADFQQNTISVGIGMTAAYLASTPTTWTLDIPDLSVAGYDAAWGLKSGTVVDWSMGVVSGNILPFIGGPPVENALITGVAADGSSSGLAADGSSAASASAARVKLFIRFPRR